MKAETKIWFCFYYTQFWKLNYFPSHHHINIMYTQYHLQSLKARGLVHSLVLQRHLGVTSDYYHLWEQRPSHCSDTFVRPDLLQCLNSWVCGGKISRNQNQKQDNSQKSRGLSALWNDDQKHKTFSSYVYTHTTITAFSHFRLNSILCYW